MEIIKDDLHYDFTVNVLKSLHLEENKFFDDVTNNASYEVQIYKWIDKLYKQGKSVEEAIQLIHRVRIIFLI